MVNDCIGKHSSINKYGDQGPSAMILIKVAKVRAYGMVIDLLKSSMT